ncbi:unnamed protein product [Ophioblennius macclurei]
MASAIPLTKANASFFLAMLKKLSEEDKKQNVFFSPFGLSAGLAMVLLGAKGNTAKQISEVMQLVEPKSLSATPLQLLLDKRSEERMKMRTQMQMQVQQRRIPGYLTKVLKSKTDKDDKESDKAEEETPKEETETSKDEAQNGNDGTQTSKDEAQTGKEESQTEKEDAPAAQEDVHAKFAELLSQFLKDDAPFKLSLANRLYGEKSYEFIKEFSEETKKHYSAELETVDFKGNAETERGNINSWVEKQTQDKIKNLLAEGSLTDKTKLLLINAIYFKSVWGKKFEVEEADSEFKLNKTDTKPVKMMHQKNAYHLKSIPEIKTQILEIPFNSEDLSMFIILPDAIEDETTGLEKLEKELTFEKFVEWTRPAAMEENLKVEVEVKLPRFKMEKTYNVEDVLKSMGMVDAFIDIKSDLTGLSSHKHMVISKVVHTSLVEVDESGGDGAASTETPTKKFIADHPFLFFIRHKPTKTVLFAGRYCSPE